MSDKPIIIIGNGGHAKVLIDILLLQNKEIIGFTTPSEEVNEYGIPYLGTDKVVFDYQFDEIELVNAIGSSSNTTLRKEIFDYFSNKYYNFMRVIHPQAIIANSVVLGEGVQIMAGAVIQSFVEIADNTIINTLSSIDHDCRIGCHCHIAPGVTISGFTTVGDSTHIGTGATIIQDVHVGNNVLIGAGSVVISNIEENRTAYGVPAKEVR